ncbi:MAG: ATP-grasp domain-containing protein [Candidatus Binatia bacterium]|nr:ATP-grasp domain-containing protein [Candidatus Binatia bacterium]
MSQDSLPTVLLPGGGGDAAIGAMRSLRRAGFEGRIVSTDANPLSTGLFLADAQHVLPPISDSTFFERALEVIEKEKIDVIFPTSGFDTLIYSQKKKELQERGVVVAMSDWPAVESCVDKWAFYEKTRDRFPMPNTTMKPAEQTEFPCFVKPVRGKGARGIAMCKDADELAYQVSQRDDLIISDYLPGEEYTIDCLSDLNGKPLVAVPRERIAVKEGICVKGRVVRDPEMEKACSDLAAFLGLQGPSCIQMKRAADGKMRFLEVNPRMGGATIFATLAGVNIAWLLLELAQGREVEIKPFREITILRHYEEVVVEEKTK